MILKTLGELCREATQLQDACNLIALANSFPAMLDNLRKIDRKHEGPIAEHPIVQLWVDKLASLSNVQALSHPSLEIAYEWVSCHMGD